MKRDTHAISCIIRGVIVKCSVLPAIAFTILLLAAGTAAAQSSCSPPKKYSGPLPQFEAIPIERSESSYFFSERLDENDNVAFRDYLFTSSSYLWRSASRKTEFIAPPSDYDSFILQDMKNNGPSVRMLGLAHSSLDPNISTFFLSTDGSFTKLPLVSSSDYAYLNLVSMNSTGSSVGREQVSYWPNEKSFAVVVNSLGQMTDLNTLTPYSPWHLDDARLINSRGDIVAVGYPKDGLSPSQHLFLRRQRGGYSVTPLTKEGPYYSYLGDPYGINSAGQIFGYQASGRFFAWSPGKGLVCNEGISIPGMAYNDGRGINDLGDIVGTGASSEAWERRHFVYNMNYHQYWMLDESLVYVPSKARFVIGEVVDVNNQGSILVRGDLDMWSGLILLKRRSAGAE